MRKAPNKSCGSYTESSPRLAITFIPIISAVSHPIPDIYTLLVNVLVLSICHMLLCLLRRICHKELTFVTSLKVSSNFKNACPHPNFGKQNVTRQEEDKGTMLGELPAFNSYGTRWRIKSGIECCLVQEKRSVNYSSHENKGESAHLHLTLLYVTIAPATPMTGRSQ